MLKISPLVAAGLAPCLLALGCSAQPEVSPGPSIASSELAVASSPPEGEINTVEIADGKVVSRATSHLSSSAYQVAAAPTYSKPAAPPITPRAKIAPKLEERLQTAERSGNTSDLIEVGVTFPETHRVPPFPEPAEGEDRNSPTNVAVQRKTAQMVADIQAAREPEYATKVADFAAKYGATITGKFWLINAMTMKVPLDQVRALAARADVLHVESALSGAPPPMNLMVEARADIVTDPYYSYTGTNIGLLDTGVNSTHTMLSSPGAIGLALDCFNGTTNYCASGTNLDPTDQINHGTASASVLIGNTNMGSENRGVTQDRLDSYQVYNNAIRFDDTSAVVRGFQAALYFFDRLIVANVQEPNYEDSMVSLAADGAFDANAAVIAPAGNNGPGYATVTAPGNAHKALAIGAVQVNSPGTLKDYSGRGPAADSRTKPDLLAPSDVMAAGNTFDTAMFLFGGTSASTPIAGGAAALMRSFLKSPNSFEFWPGYLYASMIMFGQNVTAPASDNNNGAGLINCPTNGNLAYGAVTVNPGGVVNVPVSFSAPMSYFDAAIWWPETLSQAHNDVDLFILDPSSVQRADSQGGPGVWERARATTGLGGGTWTLRIKAYSVSQAQTVYWAAFKHN